METLLVRQSELRGERSQPEIDVGTDGGPALEIEEAAESHVSDEDTRLRANEIVLGLRDACLDLEQVGASSQARFETRARLVSLDLRSTQRAPRDLFGSASLRQHEVCFVAAAPNSCAARFDLVLTRRHELFTRLRTRKRGEEEVGDGPAQASPNAHAVAGDLDGDFARCRQL